MTKITVVEFRKPLVLSKMLRDRVQCVAVPARCVYQRHAKSVAELRCPPRAHAGSRSIPH